MSLKTNDFFNKEMAQAYDERNSKLAPVKDALFFSTSLVLKNIPSTSRILCVGAGTGSEILYFANLFPEWSFVALEPSKSMLDVCRKRISEAGLDGRCEFIHGYLADLPIAENYNAVVSLFVGHFIDKNERITYFKEMKDMLQRDGYLINAEISFDLDSQQFPLMLKKWEEVQKLMGATQESLAKLPIQLKENLTVISPSKAEDQMREAGFSQPIRFFQSLMIIGWFLKK